MTGDPTGFKALDNDEALNYLGFGEGAEIKTEGLD